MVGTLDWRGQHKTTHCFLGLKNNNLITCEVINANLVHFFNSCFGSYFSISFLLI